MVRDLHGACAVRIRVRGGFGPQPAALVNVAPGKRETV
jgi:hypothetical protein